jgi:hypothetical protein
MIKNFKAGTFFISLVVIGILTFLSFMFSWDNAETTFPWVIPRILAFIFSFPFLLIVEVFFIKLMVSENAESIFMLAICLNCCLYALLIERIIYFRKKKILQNPQRNTSQTKTEEGG